MTAFRAPMRRPGSAMLALLLAASGPVEAGSVVLNEVLASNHGAVVVEGMFPDYIELLNSGPEEVDLAGASIVDDSATAMPLVFPAGTRLGPGARLVVWCDRDVPLPPPWAGFGLGAGGDRVRLSGAGGSPWDEVQFGVQAPDLAIARIPDGSGPWQLARATPGRTNVAQALGPAEALRINEWMASPSSGDDWLELYNPGLLPVALDGLVVTDSRAEPPPNRAIPALSFIAGRGHVQLFASDLRRTDADHLDFRLSATSETLRLVSRDRTRNLDRIAYGAQEADVSQGRVPDGGEAVLAFPAGRATPGAANVRPITEVVISEVLTHTDPPLEDAIELQNVSGAPVDVSHWWLSDSAGNLRKYRFPPGSIIPAGGFRVVHEIQFGGGPEGFSLNSYEGDEVWLATGGPDGQFTGGVAMAAFGALPNGASVGRIAILGGHDFGPLARRTFGQDLPFSLAQFRLGTGASNAEPWTPSVHLAEIRCPSSEVLWTASDVPFLEIGNASAAEAPLFDPAHPTNAWRLRGDVSFEFPPGLVLRSGARLLVTALDPTTEGPMLAEFRRSLAVPGDVAILGPWKGRLPVRSEAGFRIELQAPDRPEGPTKPRPGFVPYLRIDRVEYLPGSAWRVVDEAGGNKAALRRRDDPLRHGNDPAAWEAVLPSPGRRETVEPPRDADGDQDGMPDAWEVGHGLDPSSPEDALEDADGDGASNLAEHRAGTGPRDASDRLALDARQVGPDRIRLGFRAGAHLVFVLESGTGGPPGGWQVRTTFPGLGAAERVVWVPIASGPGAEFFRVRLLSVP